MKRHNRFIHTGRLRASTLVEVIVSMVLIALTATVGIIVYLNVVTSTLTLQQLKAQGALEEVWQSMKKSQRFANHEVAYEERLQIISEIKESAFSDKIKHVKLSASSPKGKVLAEQHHLILIDEAP